MFQTLGHEMCMVDVQQLVATYFKMLPGDWMNIQAHQLNPFLRALEAMGMKCLVELQYGQDKKPYYSIRKWAGLGQKITNSPMRWNLTLEDNPDFDKSWEVKLNANNEREWIRK